MKTTTRRVVLTTTASVSASTFLPQLFSALSSEHEVHVISSPGAALEDLAERFSVVPHALPMSRRISPRADLVALVRWVMILRRLRPCLVMSMTPKASLLSMVASWGTRVPTRVYLLVGLRLEGERGSRRQVLAALERLTAFAATSVVANSPSLRDAALEYRLVSRQKIATTNPGSSHGVDVHHFRPRRPDAQLASALGLFPDRPVVGFVGRITRDKGIDDLIAASCLMLREGLLHQLLVVGSHDEPDSSIYLEHLGRLAVNVVIVGHTDDVRPYYALMDVHVLPTLREGFPNVVLEAAAMQIPTVTTRATGAIDSVLHGVTGLLVSPHSPRQLAEAISDLLLDVDRRRDMGRACRNWVAREFNPSLVTASVLQAAGVAP